MTTDTTLKGQCDTLEIPASNLNNYTDLMMPGTQGSVLK